MNDAANILIVDDNQANLEVLGSMLEEAGYRVRPALSGQIALAAAMASAPDLVLLDVRMPEMDGYETCRRLRGHGATCDVPVIFISAMQDIEARLAGFQAGGVDYVSKPFQAEEVLARVRAHVQLRRMQLHLESLVAARTEALRLSEARYRTLFEDSPIPILVFDAATLTIQAVNAAYSRVLGYSAGESVGRPVDFAVARDTGESLRAAVSNVSLHTREAAFTNRLRMLHRDGEVLDIDGVLQRIGDAGKPALLMMLQDVTESRRAAERLQQAAKAHQRELERSINFDALTGLPSRRLFVERIRQETEQVRCTGRAMAVCYLDLDGFRFINDQYGGAIGDGLLVDVAACLRDHLQGGDCVARMGGDEFALLLIGMADDAAVEDFLGSLQVALSALPGLASAVTALSAGIGYTVYPKDDADPDTLLRHADQAMLLAKQVGPGRCQRFDPEGSRRIREQREIVEEVRSAMERCEFVLYYQPKVDLRSGAVFGAEALIRWRHPERGLVLPGAFLPAIESDDLIADLGDWVIAEALGQMTRWCAEGLDIAVSVNVAARHLARPGFIARLRALLDAYPQVPYGRLELEVLETSALDDIVQVEHLIAECRGFGIGFSLDDFGTGYSSLHYLRRLSADTLKIDQSFVREMLDVPGDRAIVAGVVALAAAFRCHAIAEGVETIAHARALYGLGCTLLQGYGIARPMPAEDLAAWVAAWPDDGWANLLAAGRAGRVLDAASGQQPV